MAISDDKNRLFVDTENSKGISLWEVAQCLRDYRVSRLGRDVGILCTSPNINKWALHKPVRLNSVGAITIEQRKSVRCGLQAVAVSNILTQSIGSDTSSSTTYTKDECLEEVIEWPYFPPRGVVANSYQEWFRLLDFDGYKHDAVAPDGAWGKITFKDDTIDELINATITVEGSGYLFEMIPSTNSGLYSTFAMMFNQASGAEIGTTDKMDISISDIASIDGNYRIAMAVWIPNFGESGGWGFFASRKVIGQYTAGAGDSLRDLFPDFATNPYAMYYIKKHYTDTNTKDFLAVPLLVKDLGITYLPNPAGGTNPMLCLRAVSGVTEAYCMPSGQKDVSVYFDIVSEKDVEGAEVVKFISPDGWYIAYRFAGAYTGSGSAQKPMYTLFIGSVRPITENVSAFLKCTVHFIPATTGATAQTQTIEQSFPISAGATTTINGKTYYGIGVRTMPALYLYESDVETFTVTKS